MDKYPQAPREPSVERLSGVLALRRVGKRKEKVKDGGGGGKKNPNPKQMASIGARNIIKPLLCFHLPIHLSLRGAGTVNYRLLVILWGKLRHVHYCARTKELMIRFQPSEVTNDHIIFEKRVGAFKRTPHLY